MAETTVWYDQVTDALSNPVPAAEVVLEVVGPDGDDPVYDPEVGASIAVPARLEADENAEWSATLRPNSELNPSASSYRATYFIAPNRHRSVDFRVLTAAEATNLAIDGPPYWVGHSLCDPRNEELAAVAAHILTAHSGGSGSSGPLKAHYASNDDTARGKLLGFYSTTNVPQDLFVDNTWRAHPGGAAFDISVGDVAAGEILRILIDGVVVAPSADTDNRAVLDFSAATIDALGDPLNFIHAPSGGVGTEPNAGIHDVALTGDGMQLFGLVDYVISAEDIIDSAVSVRAYYRFAEVGSPGEVRLIADQTRSFNFGVLHLEPYDA